MAVGSDVAALELAATGNMSARVGVEETPVEADLTHPIASIRKVRVRKKKTRKRPTDERRVASIRRNVNMNQEMR